ncbi:hypothetical protein AMELA_G00153900 [Ameiurus melas]|uniref:Uncharacterized protein n=1 Tax=Ameiurus melas TaxID=219545 RepID=A0A7J6AJ15_AMEME|nr:hypothetical protein AMELA_G00153900 [Ameiurus melas]
MHRADKREELVRTETAFLIEKKPNKHTTNLGLGESRVAVNSAVRRQNAVRFSCQQEQDHIHLSQVL